MSEVEKGASSQMGVDAKKKGVATRLLAEVANVPIVKALVQFGGYGRKR